MCKNQEKVQNCGFWESHVVEKWHGATAPAARATCAARWRHGRRILWIKHLWTYRKLRDRVLFYERRRFEAQGVTERRRREE